jgi:hypothetical protein
MKENKGTMEHLNDISNRVWEEDYVDLNDFKRDQVFNIFKEERVYE